jgi:hypothetical protein
MAAPWQNADGLTVKFGNYYSDPKNFVNKPLAVSTMGATKQLEVDFDLSKIPTGTVSYADDLNNDGTLDGWSDEHASIPANAAIIQVRMIFTVAAAGGTSWTVGTYRQTGAAVSATGLMTATEGVTANGVLGGRINGAGALTTATAAGVGVNNVWVGIATTGTFTAGAGRLIIDYIEGAPAAFAAT